MSRDCPKRFNSAWEFDSTYALLGGPVGVMFHSDRRGRVRVGISVRGYDAIGWNGT